MMAYSEIIRQQHLGNNLEHVLVMPESNEILPAVLLIHEYTGLDQTTLNHARRLADAGFAVLAADFYGVSGRPSSIEQARTTHRIYRNDRKLMRQRAAACLAAISRHQQIDPESIFGLGFSFGGGCILELARTGAALRGALSIYGYLDTPLPSSKAVIKCPLLAIHVENDPVVPAEHAEQFEKEMHDAEVEYELIRMNNSRHGFANPQDKGFDQIQAEWMWEKVFEWMRTAPAKNYRG